MVTFFTRGIGTSLDVDGVRSNWGGTEFESDSERHRDSDDEAFVSDTTGSNNCDGTVLA